jgi:hypothetical protein
MKMIKVLGCSKDGQIEFLNILLPAKRVVCPRCDGSGTHVNPSIDGNGLTAEDFVEDPDFRESYFSGVYDVRCERCDGNNVVDEIDEEECRKRLSWRKGLYRYFNRMELDNQAHAEAFYERQAGA